jgi:hypothetical protein
VLDLRIERQLIHAALRSVNVLMKLPKPEFPSKNASRHHQEPEQQSDPRPLDPVRRHAVRCLAGFVLRGLDIFEEFEALGQEMAGQFLLRSRHQHSDDRKRTDVRQRFLMKGLIDDLCVDAARSQAAGYQLALPQLGNLGHLNKTLQSGQIRCHFRKVSEAT